MQFLSTLSLRRATCCLLHRYTAQGRFLSTLSLRRATVALHPPPRRCFDFYPRSPCGERRGSSSKSTRCLNFYPRSPCGERRAQGRQNPAGCEISIHALLAESDTCAATHSVTTAYFYPRSPCGERLYLVFGYSSSL